jgi:hypothetical protein
MSGITPRQRWVRQRIEGLIGVAAPVLDLVLAVGDCVARIADPGGHDERSVRPAAELVLLEPPPDSRARAAGGGPA